MQKKRTETKIVSPTISLTEPYRMCVKYSEKILLPGEAIDSRYWALRVQNEADARLKSKATFVTSDTVFCYLGLESVWDNSSGDYDDVLDEISQKFYNMPFSRLRSIWYSRMNKLSGFWHIVNLTRK